MLFRRLVPRQAVLVGFLSPPMTSRPKVPGHPAKPPISLPAGRSSASVLANMAGDDKTLAIFGLEIFGVPGHLSISFGSWKLEPATALSLLADRSASQSRRRSSAGRG